MIYKEPPTEPNAPKAAEIARILMAKLILRNTTVARCQLTVLNSTPSKFSYKTSLNSPYSVSETGVSPWSRTPFSFLSGDKYCSIEEIIRDAIVLWWSRERKNG
jgi:hypothetical protein